MKNLEIRRQAFHVAFGLSLIFLISFEILNAGYLLIILLIGILLSQLSKKKKIPMVYHFLHFFERPKEKESFPGKGPIFFVAGATFVVSLFPIDIALASIMILTLGDAIPPLLGRKFGKNKSVNNFKKYVGLTIGVIASVIGASFFVSYQEAIIASVIALLIEGIELKYNKISFDDNLVIPIIAATAMGLIRIIL